VQFEERPESTPVQQQIPKPIGQTLAILMSSIGLGILADWLFRADLLGINVSLFVSAIALSFFIWSRQLKQDTLNLILLGSWLLLSWLFVWRASPFLQVLNLSVQLFLLLLLAARLSTRAFMQSNFAEMVINAVITGLFLPFRPLVFLLDARWNDLNKFKNNGNAKILIAVTRGLLIALPLLVVFAFLFASADAVFENLLNKVFNFKLEKTIGHLFVIGIASFIVLAFLAQMLFGSSWKTVTVSPPDIFRLGFIETSLIFGSLAVLFFSFMVVQFGYLFGGEARVLGSDITYAQYGRRGFFELVTVAVLLHIILLLGLWFISEQKARNLYRNLATMLVILLYGVIWSAQNRLDLYIRTYGLTELRYYSSAMIYWIGLVMFYFLFRLYSSKAPKLAPSYIVLGLLGVIALYISNPDARIATVNLEGAKELNKVDVDYLDNLSLDAMPVIARFSQTQQDWDLDSVLSSKYYSLPDSDWRQFNWGRWRGSEVLKAIYQVSL
jgi:Domain of unknown function (DUF4173)